LELNGNIKLEDSFPDAQFCVERNGGLIELMCSDKDHIKYPASSKGRREVSMDGHCFADTLSLLQPTFMAKPHVTISNPDKLYFPGGFKKVDMIRYYVSVASAILPHLKNRPVTLIRFPNGLKGEKFYEKNAPGHAPDWIKTAPVPRQQHDGVINYILINDVETLARPSHRLTVFRCSSPLRG
jgi:hypothetical protein